jgi:hypothetical protein
MKLFLKFAAILFIISCKKEKAIIQEVSTVQGVTSFNTDVLCSESVDSLHDFPEMDGIGYMFGDNYWIDDTIQKYPCFNPGSANEISYVEQYRNGDNKFIKQDVNSHQKITLAENVRISSQPVWCSNNWSYFIGNGRNVCRIEMTTGEFQQLTHSDLDLFITSNIETGEFTFVRMVSTSEMYALESNAIGSVIDSVWRHAYGDWRGDLMVGSIRSSGISSLTPDRRSSTVIHMFDSGWWIDNIKIHPNNADIYSSGYQKGLYKTNKNSGDTVLLKDGKMSCYYPSFSISQDGRQIVFEKLYSEIHNGSIIYNDSKIWIMDIHGCNERRLF